jgi:hypothetical protein
LQVDVTYSLSLINGGSKLHTSWISLTLKNKFKNKFIVSYYATYNTIHNNDESLENNFKIKYLRVKINLWYRS